ncbi:MAG: TIGR00725 family protein [Deltaproteobacteria bacterium]|nr:TIGR00725 family protein [Deltaproteobacteria bacterium]
MKEKAILIGVIGGGDYNPEIDRVAEEVGRGIARRGAVLINGGLGGVMEASARGAKGEGGLTIGILPGISPREANPYIDIPIPTGLGDMRNFLIVRSAHSIIAINGGYGTLSELAIALKLGRPVIGIKTWEISKDITVVANAKEAVERAIDAAKGL